MPDLTISVVTPSFNQGRFIEQTIQSVLGQGYPNLEYVIIDGGSTDNAPDVIERYADQLTYWVSEPDNGMYDAINKGFARTSGDIMAWINSDDMYTPWAFQVVNAVFNVFPQVEWITTCFPVYWGEHGEAYTRFVPGYTRQGFFRGENLRVPGFPSHYIQQESTFWRRSLWERAGGLLDTSYSIAADFDLWARFYQHTDLYGVHASIGGFRVHSGQQTATGMDRYFLEGAQAIQRYGGSIGSASGSMLRKLALRFFPARIARLNVPGTNLLYRANNCRYNLRERLWIIETTFI